MSNSKILGALTFLALAALPASAQSYVFRINQGASSFTWTGTSTLGPIVGNPSNAFQFAGTTQLDLGTAPSATVTTAAFTGGDAFTVPDLHGRIPNPIPILPPIATIDVLGLHVTASSPVVPVLAGAFNASITLTATAGTMNVTPLVGAPSSTPLAGSSSAPTMVSGTVSLVGSGLRLVAPISTSFAFADPTSGASGTIALVGTLDATFALHAPYCFGDGSGTACPCGNNSAPAAQSGCLSSIGAGGRLQASGLPIVSADTLSLNASAMPATVACLYFQGTAAENGGLGSLRGDGLLCTGGTLLRLGTRANAGGASSFPGPGGPLVSVRGGVNLAGGTYFYQAWYRNAAAFCTSETFNLTNGLAVTWLP